jgi:hypothetical protein
MSNNIQEQAIDAANPVLDAMGEVAGLAGYENPDVKFPAAEPFTADLKQAPKSAPAGGAVAKSPAIDSLSDLEKQGEVLGGMFGVDEEAFEPGAHKIQFTRSAGGSAINAGTVFVREPDLGIHLSWMDAGEIHAAALRQAFLPVGCDTRDQDAAPVVINALPPMNERNARGNPRYPTIEGVKAWGADAVLNSEADAAVTDVVESLLAKVAGEDRRLRELTGHNDIWNGLRRVFVEKVELDALMDNVAESKTYQFLDFVGLDYQMRYYEHTSGVKPRVFLIVNDTERRISGALFLGSTSAVEIVFAKAEEPAQK